MNEIELAKEAFEKRKQTKIKVLKPVYVKSIGENSPTFFTADGKRVALTKFGQDDFDFILAGR